MFHLLRISCMSEIMQACVITTAAFCFMMLVFITSHYNGHCGKVTKEKRER